MIGRDGTCCVQGLGRTWISTASCSSWSFQTIVFEDEAAVQSTVFEFEESIHSIADGVARCGSSVVNAVNVGLRDIFEDVVFVRDFVSFVRDLCATCARLVRDFVRNLCATCAPFVHDLVRELCAEQMSRSASEQKRNEPRVCTYHLAYLGT